MTIEQQIQEFETSISPFGRKCQFFFGVECYDANVRQTIFLKETKMIKRFLFSSVTALVLVMSSTLNPQSVHAQSDASEHNSKANTFQSMPCPPDIFPDSVRVDCGFVTVPENRAHPNGRMIQVAAAVVHAPARHPKKDPIVFLDGGPSFGAISTFALDAYFAGASFIEDRDIILVDTRGTGLSQPRLGCPEFDEADESSFYSSPYVGSSFVEEMTQAVTDCHNRLTAVGIDLAAYNSAESAADIDALRRALGYKEWNLLAFSADGVLGLTYMRLYPDGIRSAIIDSGSSPQHLWNIDYYLGVNEEFERIFAGCAANSACNAAYPNLRKVFFDLVHQLRVDPVNISIPHFVGGPIVLHVDGVEFYLDTITNIFPGDLYSSDSIRPLLAEIWRSAHGQLAEVYRERFSGPAPVFDANSFVAMGKTMSYTCHDLIGFEKPADFEQTARDLPELAPFFLNPDAFLPMGPTGCPIWNVGRANEVQHQPVVSAIPTLVLAGEYDGAIPPLMVRQIPGTLPNSFYYEFAAGAHAQLASYNTASTCARSIATQFLDQPTKKPDSSCIAALPQFDFTPE